MSLATAHFVGWCCIALFVIFVVFCDVPTHSNPRYRIGLVCRYYLVAFIVAFIGVALASR